MRLCQCVDDCVQVQCSRAKKLPDWRSLPLRRSNAARAAIHFRSLNELYDRLGMSFSVSAGTESAGFGGKSLTEDFEHLLEVGQQVLLHPKFPELEIEKLRGQSRDGFA